MTASATITILVLATLSIWTISTCEVEVNALVTTTTARPFTPKIKSFVAASSSSSLLGGIFGSNNNSDNNDNNKNTGIRIELFDPNDEKTLALLRTCRRTAFPDTKQNFLDSERDFCLAANAVSGKHLCAVAWDDCGNSNKAVVVGSCDLVAKSKGVNSILNVFVTPDARSRGIGRQLMVEGIEGVLARNLPASNLVANVESTTATQTTANAAVLSLDVYTQNTPAIALYQNLGYEPSSPMHKGTLALANALGTNFVVNLSKTVPIE